MNPFVEISGGVRKAFNATMSYEAIKIRRRGKLSLALMITPHCTNKQQGLVYSQAGTALFDKLIFDEQQTLDKASYIVYSNFKTKISFQAILIDHNNHFQVVNYNMPELIISRSGLLSTFSLTQRGELQYGQGNLRLEDRIFLLCPAVQNSSVEPTENSDKSLTQRYPIVLNEKSTNGLNQKGVNENSAKGENENLSFVTSGSSITETDGELSDTGGIGEISDEKKNISDTIERYITEDPNISAHSINNKILSYALMQKNFMAQSDMSSISLYARRPRRLLVCSGAPYQRSNDKLLSEMINEYAGEIVVSGGTTAQIVARELSKELRVNLRPDPSGLPPTSQIQGIDIVCEGVLTLSSVVKILKKVNIETNNEPWLSTAHSRGVDYQIVKKLLTNDFIEFVVGTRINDTHQDPTLPIELGNRRQIIKEIAQLLTDKFSKEVKIDFI